MTEEKLLKNGFMLLEVVISLLIAGILIGLVAVGVQRSCTSFNLQIAAERLAQDIRSVQQRALSEKSSNYFIAFYPASNHYSIKKSAGLSPLKIAEIKLPRGVGLYTTNFESNKLLVSAQGTVSCGGTITLIDRSTGRLKYVIVASITGRVRVSDLPPKNWENV
jgi:type II secretory pathway pseudopilin PulG